MKLDDFKIENLTNKYLNINNYLISKESKILIYKSDIVFNIICLTN